MNKSKREFLLITIVLSTLLIYSVYTSPLPLVHATEPTVQDETMEILSDVVGVNTESYATLYSQLDKQHLNLPQTVVDTRLVSEKGGLRASCSFVNNLLWQIYLSDYKGNLAVTQSASATAEMAKSFLQRYQSYAGDSFYGELSLMLDNVDVSTNITKSAGNIKLEIHNSDNTILDYVWTYVDENGIVAKTKNVALSYDQGQLKVFLNNWPFYKVVGTPKISAEEATAIAMQAAKTFSYKVSTDNGTSTVTGFNIAPESLGRATLSYVNFPNQSIARGNDPLTLYPSWYVPLGFDKFYPGDVSGMTMTVWADTGEVSMMNPIVVNSGFASSNNEVITFDENGSDQEGNQEPTVFAVPFMIVAVFGVTGVYVGLKKKITSGGNKKRFVRFWAILLSELVLISLVLVATPTVNASEVPDSKARIYASLYGDPDQIETE